MSNFIKNLEKKFNIEVIEYSKLLHFKNTFSTNENGTIKTLYLQGISLKSLKLLLPIAESVEVLFLFDCEIDNIKEIYNFKKIKKLDLSINPLSKLDGIESLENLEELILVGIDIKSNVCLENLKNLKKLKYLNLDSTYLSSICGLENIKSLKRLSLNNMSDLKNFQDIEIMNNITWLDLESSHNLDFKNLEIDKIKNLEILFLNCCNINSFSSLKKITNLKQLYLENATLEAKLDLEGLNNLQLLDLNNNEMTKIEGINSLSNLIMLNLSTNNIKEVEDIEGLRNLEFIDLRDNKLTNLKKNGFKGIEKECIIDVGFNSILDYKIETPGNIKIVFNQEGGNRNILPLSFSFRAQNLKKINVRKYCNQIKKKYEKRIKKFGLESSLKFSDFK